MEPTEIQLLVFVSTIIVLFLAVVLMYFFFYFQQKKSSYLIKQREIQQQFEEEITKSKMEIQEQALQNISWEIHDNVGQLLSVAKMQLNILQMSLPEKEKHQIIETGEIIGKSLYELRGLAKSLNPETIKNNGLLDAISMEMDRFNRLNILVAELKITNEPFNLSNEKEIILFRILQEFCNNTLKYSKAEKLKIELIFGVNQLEIYAKDNGIGFDVNDKLNRNGIGLLNINSRANLIGAKIDLKSSKNNGTKLYISCPKEKQP